MPKKTRSEMIKFILKHTGFAKPTEELGRRKGGILVMVDPFDEFKGLPLYDYYADDEIWKREYYYDGLQKEWEKELNKRGWYSEWYDPGSVEIFPIDEEGWQPSQLTLLRNNPSSQIGGAVIAAAVLGYVLGKK